jgi:cytochrome o ubiquinol oxidase subunit 2
LPSAPVEGELLALHRPEDPAVQTPAWQHGVLDPQGPIAAAERTILLNATVIMAAVVVPVILLTLAFAWWFRAGNKWARRAPDWAYSGPVEVTVWSIPTLVILFLGGIAWIGSHDLDPARPVAASTPPLEVQVVSLDWKWLFIYPDLGVASVNRLVVPAGTPLRLHLTSASVMNSFFVPQLGSQIYTMAGMTTTLHLQADKPGTTPAGFTEWLAAARASTDTLDAMHYTALAHPGVPASTATWGHVAPGLFQTILATSVKPPTTAPAKPAPME